MASPPSTNFFFFFLLSLVLPVTLAFPAANGCLARLGLSAAPGSWPRSMALAVSVLILANIFHPPTPGVDRLCILLAYWVLSVIPGAAASWLLFPNALWATNQHPPPKGDIGSSTTPVSDSEDEEGDPSAQSSATSYSKTRRQQVEISRLHEALAAARRNQRSAQATDKATFDKIISKLEKDIARLKTELEAARQQPPSITVTGSEGIGWLNGISKNFTSVAMAAIQGLSNRSSATPNDAPYSRAPASHGVEFRINGLGGNGGDANPTVHIAPINSVHGSSQADGSPPTVSPAVSPEPATPSAPADASVASPGGAAAEEEMEAQQQQQQQPAPPGVQALPPHPQTGGLNLQNRPAAAPGAITRATAASAAKEAAAAMQAAKPQPPSPLRPPPNGRAPIGAPPPLGGAPATPRTPSRATVKKNA